LAFKSGKHGAKAKFQLSQLFYNSGFICCTYAAGTQISEATTRLQIVAGRAHPSVFRGKHRASLDSTRENRRQEEFNNRTQAFPIIYYGPTYLGEPI
jgi:hypothetical protein